MSIVNFDGVIAGAKPPKEFEKSLSGTLVAARPHSYFYTTGIPGPAVACTAGIGGEVLTTYPGQIPFTNPVSGNTYLSRFVAQVTQPGTVLLCDRLWHNSDIDETSTSEQLFTGSAQIPARDANGTTDGDEVYAAVEVSSLMGAGTPTITLKYTNQDGTQNQTATNIMPVNTASIAGTFYPIGLAAGDTGIQKAQSITLSATMTSGVIHVVLYRVLARLEITTAHVPNALDVLTSGFPRVYDNTVPFLVFIPQTTTTSQLRGEVIFAQG